jgi:hypothetical protein
MYRGERGESPDESEAGDEDVGEAGIGLAERVSRYSACGRDEREKD